VGQEGEKVERREEGRKERGRGLVEKRQRR